MDVAEFVDMVTPGIGERCPATDCGEYQDHFCRPDGGGYCITHCRCEYEIQGRFEGAWEMVTTVEGLQEAREMLACYRENDPGRRYRVKVSAGE